MFFKEQTALEKWAMSLKNGSNNGEKKILDFKYVLTDPY